MIVLEAEARRVCFVERVERLTSSVPHASADLRSASGFDLWLKVNPYVRYREIDQLIASRCALVEYMPVLALSVTAGVFLRLYVTTHSIPDRTSIGY